jgi:hypothetical protein
MEFALLHPTHRGTDEGLVEEGTIPRSEPTHSAPRSRCRIGTGLSLWPLAMTLSPHRPKKCPGLGGASIQGG